MKILIAIIAIISLIWLVIFIIKGFKNARDLQSEIEDFEKLQDQEQKIEYFYIFKAPYRKSYKIFRHQNEAQSFAALNPKWLVSMSKEGESFDTLDWHTSSTVFESKTI